MKWYIILSLFFLSACKEDTQPAPTCSTPCIDCEENGLKVVWQKALSPDFESCWSMNPIVDEDNVIMSDYSCGVSETIRYYDGRSGDLLWEWDDYLDLKLVVDIKKTGEELVISTFREIYSIALAGGQTIWRTNVYKGEPRINIIGNNVYHARSNAIPDADTTYLRRSPVDQEAWETKLILTKKDGYAVSTESYALYLHPTSQDSILIFQNRQYNFPLGDGKVDLTAYNLAQDTFLWYIEDITPTGNSSIYSPIIKDDRIYFQGGRNIFCVAAETGEVIWQKEPGSSYFICEMQLVSNMLIVKGDNRQIDALNPLDGSLIWHKEEIGANVENMAIYKDRIYYGSDGDGALRCLDLFTGNLLWIEASPNNEAYPRASFTSGVAINEDLGYLYVHDKYFAMCIDLNE